MVASAVFITDLSGKMIISRNYRGDVPMSKAVERFCKYLLDTPDEQKSLFFTWIHPVTACLKVMWGDRAMLESPLCTYR